MLPLENYYFLLHAFDVLGRRLFSGWTGDEIVQRFIEPPEAVAAAREPYENRIAAIYAEYDERNAAIGRITAGDEIAAHRKAMAQLLEERNDCQQKLSPMPQLNDDYYRDRAAYERRTVAETRFFEALESGAIRAQLGHGPYIEWATWSRERGFKCYLGLSLVVALGRCAMRRGTALIRRVEFDKWLETALPEDQATRQAMDAEAACEVWLLNLIRDSKGQQPDSRDAICEAACRALPELSERQFLRVWARVVPPDWRKPGRRPGT
jgi:hypothetical protein